MDATALASSDTGCEITAEHYARLRGHPGYPDAVRLFTRKMLASADSDPAIDGMMKDAGRTMAGLCTAYLHATGGITLARLKSLMSDFGLTSPGRVRALLIYMVYLGFVELRPVRAAGRPAPYVPTARFLTLYRTHLRAILEGIEALEPSVLKLLDRFDRPGVFETFVTHMAKVFLDATRQGHDQAAFYRVFMHRHAGIQIMHALVSDGMTEPFPPVGPLPFSATATARRFKVSKVHVHRLIGAGAKEGLLLVSPGAVILTPAGRETVDWIYATQLIHYLAAAARTAKAMPELFTAPEGARVA